MNRRERKILQALRDCKAPEGMSDGQLQKKAPYSAKTLMRILLELDVKKGFIESRRDGKPWPGSTTPITQKFKDDVHEPVYLHRITEAGRQALLEAERSKSRRR